MESDIDFYKHFTWLKKVNFQSPVNNETYQERLTRLEGDKESLVLQVSVLTDQVEAQGEKIRDLESSLDEHQHKLNTTEEMLQQELLSRTSLETQKLDLMDEVSYLKLKLVGMEEEQNDGENRQHKAECVVNLISELQEQMCKFQKEINDRIKEKKPLEKQTDCSPQEASKSQDAGLYSLDAGDPCCCREENSLLQELRLLKTKVDELEEEKSQYERKLKATKLSISYSLHVCYQSLMTKLSSLKLTVEHMQVEKQHWEERCRTAQAEIVELQQILSAKDAEIGNLQSQLLSRGPVTNDTTEKEEVYRRRLTDKNQELQRLKIGMESLLMENNEKDRRIEELTVLLSQYRKIKEVMALAQVSNEKLLSGSSEEELSGSLKMRALTHKAHSEIMRSEMSSRESSPLFVSSSSFQKEIVSSCRSAQMSPEPVVSPSDSRFQNGLWIHPRMLSSSLEELQSRSLQKHIVGKPIEPVVSAENCCGSNKYQTLPGKLPRSDENGEKENFSPPIEKSPDESEDSDFNLRKTEKMDDTTSSDLSPMSSGVDSGQQSPVSPENKKNHKGIKKFWGKIRRTQSGSLHGGDDMEPAEFQRGGLRATAGPRLARTNDTASSIRDKNTPFSKWTTEQVCGWLEDYGLAQYVNLARQWVNDGQTLLSATPQDLEKNDLLFLKVTSQLHHLSIKCAIHVLHVNKFNPHCLKRRPGDENKISSSEVVQWSNHRVMEWLRSVDLAEYAPNLRGSGVHGGLIILEPRFNSDTLAMLLNIPPQKTLLRRHLATNFNSLVGLQAQQEKRDYMESSGYVPLTTTAKVRPKKLGFSNFGHLRKKKVDDSTDYICPMDAALPAMNGAHRPYSGFRGLSPIFDRDTERLEQVGQKS
ncbi:hypothetical protein JZ751_027105 [Albula glossodonta]|uniref:SAM domain-containing protein n=1 Tax=Albula glossodonta TaxID=121402 RepID=A0A8T2NCG7_9TELE|nr:hypothetical protein JZ751_027105 [Albula glossodonta]